MIGMLPAQNRRNLLCYPIRQYDDNAADATGAFLFRLSKGILPRGGTLAFASTALMMLRYPSASKYPTL